MGPSFCARIDPILFVCSSAGLLRVAALGGDAADHPSTSHLPPLPLGRGPGGGVEVELQGARRLSRPPSPVQHSGQRRTAAGAVRSDDILATVEPDRANFGAGREPFEPFRAKFEAVLASFEVLSGWDLRE